MEPVKKKRAAIYCRMSQDREGAGLGVDRQRADCETLARKLGWTVVATHTDNDVSAYSGKPRPGYRALLADLEASRVDAVLVWHTDRLHRSPRELEEYVDLCERRKVTTQTVKAGELDLATPSGRAVARTLGAWSRFEVEHKSDRQRAARLQSAQAGRWLGGMAPLGWNVREDGSATLDRAAAARIRRATAQVLAGASLGSITKQWNAAGFKTSTGKTWTYTRLRQTLTRARNAGLMELHGEIVGRSTWPAIVTEDQWRALRALLADPSRRSSPGTRARWLLSGIAVCGVDSCGLTLRSAGTESNTRTGERRTVYRCRATGPGHVARSAEPLDHYVTEIIAARLSSPDLVDLLDAGNDDLDLDALRTEATALRGRLTEAADQFATGAITAAQLARITERVRTELAVVEATLAGSARGSVLAGIVSSPDPARAFRTAPIDRRRAIVREMVTVTVLPGRSGNTFDPSLISIGWKDQR